MECISSGLALFSPLFASSWKAPSCPSPTFQFRSDCSFPCDPAEASRAQCLIARDISLFFPFVVLSTTPPFPSACPLTPSKSAHAPPTAGVALSLLRFAHRLALWPCPSTSSWPQIFSTARTSIKVKITARQSRVLLLPPLRGFRYTAYLP